MKVTCPICNLMVENELINHHIDSGCQQHKKPRVSPKTNLSLKKDLPIINDSFKYIPLAERARPDSWDNYVGDVNPIIKTLSENQTATSLILWGPPGCGKTTLARIIAKEQACYFKEFSATQSNLEEIRKFLGKARISKQKSILFLDEIHRFTKAQQDVFLPGLERGDFVLIAATTENPSFKCTNALISRCKVLIMEMLKPCNILAILKNAQAIKGHTISDDLLEYLSNLCEGDARVGLNCLEMVIDTMQLKNEVATKELILNALQKTHLRYDRDGDEHYNIISALHKSMRGSDKNASLYWLGRMMYAGEDPTYIARRLVRFASEDIGLADSNALGIAVNTFDACQKLGMPECDVILAHCVTYLAEAPKSIQVYKAMKKMKRFIQDNQNWPVPLHLRNAPTGLMKDLDFGKDYKYTPDDPEAYQSFLPDACPTVCFFD